MTDQQPGGAPDPQPPYPTQPAYEPRAAPPVAPAPRRIWPWLLGGGIVLVLALIAIGVVVLVNVLVGATAAGGAEQVRETVQRFDRSFEDADCELFERVTSSELRDTIYDGAYDCAAFEQNAASFRVDGEYTYEVEITGIDIAGDTATVTTVETDGASDPAQSFDYTYTLARSAGAWVITTLE